MILSFLYNSQKQRRLHNEMLPLNYKTFAILYHDAIGYALTCPVRHINATMISKVPFN